MPDIDSNTTADDAVTTAAGSETTTDTGASTDVVDTGATGTDAGATDAPKVFDETYVSGLRGEAAKHRTEKQAEKARADKAEADYKALVASLGKAAGFVTDDTEPDPAELLAQVTAEREAEREKVHALTLRDAVREASGPLKADASALLDSTKFLGSVRKIDPAADDYATQVAAEIEKALTENPKLAAAPVVASRSGGDTSTGSTEVSTQVTREQLAAMSSSERLKAHREGRTKNLLGGK